MQQRKLTLDPAREACQKASDNEKIQQWLRSARKRNVPFIVIFIEENGLIYPVEAQSQALAEEEIKKRAHYASGKVYPVR